MWSLRQSRDNDSLPSCYKNKIHALLVINHQLYRSYVFLPDVNIMRRNILLYLDNVEIWLVIILNIIDVSKLLGLTIKLCIVVVCIFCINACMVIRNSAMIPSLVLGQLLVLVWFKDQNSDVLGVHWILGLENRQRDPKKIWNWNAV